MIKVSKWNESVFSITPSNPRIKMRLKKTGLVKGFNDGQGVDAFITLDKPIPYIDFNYDYKNVAAYHQPELTALEKVREHRPEHVINSVAFYHPTKRNNEYKTGKIGHLYNDLLVDARGLCSWNAWTVEKHGILRKWLDQTFLRIGTPPFRIVPVGDTFGSEVKGGGTQTIESYTYGIVSACSGAGTVTKLSACLVVTTEAHKCTPAIYDNASPSNPIANGTVTEQDIAVSDDWVDFTFASAPTVSATDYILTVSGEATNGAISVYGDTGTATRYYESITYPTLHTDVTWDGSSANKMLSIHVDYTSSSAPIRSGSISQSLLSVGII